MGSAIRRNTNGSPSLGAKRTTASAAASPIARAIRERTRASDAPRTRLTGTATTSGAHEQEDRIEAHYERHGEDDRPDEPGEAARAVDGQPHPGRTPGADGSIGRQRD